MIAKPTYEKPEVRTLSGRFLTESLGPVSCGSFELAPGGNEQPAPPFTGRCGGGKNRMW